jgi:hypothetical protein
MVNIILLTDEKHFYLNDTGNKQKSTMEHNEQTDRTFTKIIHLFQRTVQFVLSLCCWHF